MTILTPAALALAALAVPIVALYMLRTRRAPTRVSSTMLWLPDDRPVAANTPWRPLRWSVLLALQLLALALLVLTLARPAIRTDAPLAEHTVVIVDTSGSMSAAHAEGTRLDEAKRRALASVERLGGGQTMSVIAAGPRASVVASGSDDRAALRAAITALEPTDGVADLAGAFALGASLETAERATLIHLLSDGAVAPEHPVRVPEGVVHLRVGEPAGNVAVERIVTTPARGAWEAFVRLRNTGPAPVEATLRITDDERTLARRAVLLPPSDATEVSLGVSAPGGTAVRAVLEDLRTSGGDPAPNALATDDSSAAILESGETLRVVLMSPGNVFLESLVRSIPGAELTVSERPTSARGATLAIYDRVRVPPELTVPSLVIAAPGGAPGVRVRGTREHPLITSAAPREPVLAHVDVSRIAIREAQRVRAPGYRALVRAGDDPMIAIGIPGGTRAAYLAFDLRESNLPVQVAFPLLFGNLLDWLGGAAASTGSALVAGDALPLRIPGGTARIEIEHPGGAVTLRDHVRTVFDETPVAGVYRARYLAGDEELGTQSFAVGIPAAESDLAVAQLAGDTPRTGVGGTSTGGVRTIGALVVAAALAVLLVEWWIAHGRPRPGRRYDRRGEPA